MRFDKAKRRIAVRQYRADVTSAAMAGPLKKAVRRNLAKIKKAGRIAAAGALLPFAPATATAMIVGKKNLKKGAKKVKAFARKNKRAIRAAAGAALLPFAPMTATGLIASTAKRRNLQKIKTAFAKAAAKSAERGSIPRSVAEQVIEEKFGPGPGVQSYEDDVQDDAMRQESQEDQGGGDDLSVKVETTQPEKKKSKILPLILAAAPIALGLFKKG